MSKTVPTGFTLRPATLDDGPAIYDRPRSHERALYGYSDGILTYVQATYSSSTLDLARDTCLVFDQTERLIGSMVVGHNTYTGFGVTTCVSPLPPICIWRVLRSWVTQGRSHR